MLTRRQFVKSSAALPVIASIAVPSRSWAEVGISSDKIVFGQAAALDGPASALGKGMRSGIHAAFEEANRAGGIKGRKLVLISKDDGYEPNKSIEATKELINADGVFALIGPVGTPTSAATQPIAEAAGVPFIGPFTGAEFLRNPFKPNVINVRASYFQETEVMVERLTKDLGVNRIAILFQDDAFGRAGLEGVRIALTKRSLSLASEASFERNTVAVKSAVLEIKKSTPEAVILIGPYKPCAEFIKLAKQVKLEAKFINISFVGSDALAKELGAAGGGVIVTQVVPFPGDKSIPIVARFHEAMTSIGAVADVGFVSLEGYIVGRAAIAGLGKVQGDITRKSYLDALLSGDIDLGGAMLRYKPGANLGMDEVFLTILQADGAFKPIKSLRDAAG